MNKNEGKKLFAAIVAVAMVFAMGVVVLGGSTDSDATEFTGTPTKAVNGGSLIGTSSPSEYFVMEDMSLNVTANIAAVSLYLKNGVTVTISSVSDIESGTINVYIADLTESDGNIAGTYDNAKSVSIVGISAGSITIKSTGAALEVSGNVTASTVTGTASVSSVATGSSFSTGATVTNVGSGIVVTNSGVKTFYSSGATAPKATLANGDTVVVTDGSIKVQQGNNVIELKNIKSADATAITITGTADLPTISGTVSEPGAGEEKGSISITLGVFLKTGTFSYANANINAVNLNADVAYSSQIVGTFGYSSTAVTTAKICGIINQTLDATGTVAVTLNDNSSLVVSESTVMSVTSIVVGSVTQKVTVSGGIITTGAITGFTGNEIQITPTGYVKCGGSITLVEDIITGDDTVTGGDLVGETAGALILAKNGNVPAGKTYTITSDFGLNGYTLTVAGTLVIATGANVFGTTLASEGIILVDGGSIIVDGYLAKNMPIKISETDNSSSVSVQGVEGVQYSIQENASEDKVITISGDVKAVAGTPASTIVFGADAQISGNLTIGKGVIVVGNASSTEILSGSIMTIDGTLDSKVTLVGESQLIVNGSVAVGAVITAADSTITIADGNLSGLVVETVKIKQNPIAYGAFISGDISFFKVSAQTKTSMTIGTAKVFVDEGAVLALGDKVEFSATDGTNALIDIAGTVTKVGMDAVAMDGWIGASYTITTGVDPNTVETYYCTTISNAISNIASADDKEITLSNISSIEDGFDLATGETVNLAGETVVKSSAEITVATGATITGTISKVSGKLTLETGAVVSTPVTYDAKYTEGTSTVYAGLAIAVRDSDGSKPIQVTSSDVDGNLTVPTGKSIEVSADITISGNLLVEGGASIIGKTAAASIVIVGDVEEGATAVINGEVTVSELQMTNAALTVNGKLTVGTEITGTVNAAKYADGTDTVYTNIIGALASEEDVTVLGTVVEKNTVTVVDGQKLTIDADAKATLPSIVLEDEATLTANAPITSNVNTGVAQFDIKGTIVVANAINSEDVLETNITDLIGNLVVVDGLAIIANSINMTGGEISVENGATLVIKESKTLTIDADTELNIDGDVIVDGTITATSTSAVIDGTMAVNGNASFDNITIIGVVVVDDAATLTISGIVVVGSIDGIGSNGALEGTLDVGFDYIRAFAGSEVSEETVAGLKHTTFFVNGSEFVTIYTSNASLNITDSGNGGLEDDVVADLPGVVVPTTGISWAKENGTKVNSSVTVIGQYDVLKTTLASEKVTALVYVQAGIELQLGYGYYYTESEATLSIGSNLAVGSSDDGRSVVVKVFFNGIEVPVENGYVMITADMVGQDVVVQASYGTTPVPTPEPTEPSKDILVSVVSDGTGVKIYLVSLDGGYIAPGKVSVKYYYTIVSPEYGPIGLYDAVEVDVLEADISADGRTAVVSVDLSAQTGYSGITSVEAAFGDFTSAKIVYTPVAVI